jgi:hypothetical protein
MTAHQNRTGQFLTSAVCKRTDHTREQCEEFTATMTEAAGGEPPIHCHCPCHPLCMRLECQVARTKGRGLVSSAPFLPPYAKARAKRQEEGGAGA